MALFEGYERRIENITKVLNSYGIKDIEEARKITDEIAGFAKASVLAKLKEQKEQVALADQQREQPSAKKKEECL